MITYEAAYEIAKEIKPDIDNVAEYDNAFVFGCKADDGYIGGNHSPVVILKEDGRAVSMPWFIAKIGAGREIRSFDL